MAVALVAGALWLGACRDGASDKHAVDSVGPTASEKHAVDYVGSAASDKHAVDSGGPAAGEPQGSAPAGAQTAVGHQSERPPVATLVRPESLSKAGVIERHAVKMGTPVDILLVAEPSPAAEQDVQAAFAEIDRVERLISSWREDSQISALNRAAGVEPVRLDDEVLDLLEDAVSLCALTSGRFDVTFKGAGDLWDFRSSAPRPPPQKAVAAALSRVDCTALRLDRTDGTGFLAHRGMAVGLGAIGKGYAVDRAAATLRARGHRDFVINAGGDLYASGRLEARLWQVAVRHPRHDSVMALVPLSNLAVATSGDYEQFFVWEGQRYHHILDPTTGYPAVGCQSVTVVAPAAYLADALATGVFVLGPQAGLALVERLEGVEAAVVDQTGAVHRSSGLATPP